MPAKVELANSLALKTVLVPARMHILLTSLYTDRLGTRIIVGGHITEGHRGRFTANGTAHSRHINVGRQMNKQGSL